MKILFEEYHYKTSNLEKILEAKYFNSIDHDCSKINYVGYYYNSEIQDVIFIFPKVFIYNGMKAFGCCKPEEIMDCSSSVMDKLGAKGKDKIIYELSVWMYQAMRLFIKRKVKDEIYSSEYINNIVSAHDDSRRTELDIILTLVQFHKENRHLFTLIIKSSHSQQHKIQWAKTIRKKNPILINNIPIYIDVISKGKCINYDEELVNIFYSVLNYLSQKYSFKIEINEQYNIIKGKDFDKYLLNGTKILKAIKYKYYSDKFIESWNLLYVFFERIYRIRSGNKFEEVIMVKDFHIVFEDMIDCLIGDHTIPDYFKNHKDGKRIDHIYEYNSLTEKNDNIYFVGDSKYYKPDKKDFSTNSIAKQYTYAKNVIQYSIDLFNNGTLKRKIRYRDPLTEGYNITPNFFISAFVDEDFNFMLDHLQEESQTYPINLHFENRIFDRDTLFLKAYNINFLFVLSAYISRNSIIRSTFKDKARKMFREKMITFFNDEYSFYKVTPTHDNIEDFVTKNFRRLNGKMYRPTGMENSILVGLKKGDKITISTLIDKDDAIYEPIFLV